MMGNFLERLATEGTVSGDQLKAWEKILGTANGCAPDLSLTGRRIAVSDANEITDHYARAAALFNLNVRPSLGVSAVRNLLSEGVFDQ
jgi:hypothetical protein